MVVVGSVYEKNKIIKDPDQEIYARHFDRFAAHQACCNVIKLRKTEIKDKF